jgi:hypothetical protein
MSLYAVFTSVLPYLELAVYTFANPILLLGVMALHPIVETSGIRLVSPQSYNSLQLHWRPYLLLCLVLGAVWQVLLYFVLTAGQGISFMAFLLSQEVTVFGWLVYIVSLWCLYMFADKKGIEGNVMGFIFFPVLLAGSAYQVIHHFVWVYDHYLTCPYVAIP